MSIDGIADQTPPPPPPPPSRAPADAASTAKPDEPTPTPAIAPPPPQIGAAGTPKRPGQDIPDVPPPPIPSPAAAVAPAVPAPPLPTPAPIDPAEIKQAHARAAAAGVTGPQEAPASPLEAAMFEVKRVIVGQSRMLERIMVCLLAKGHCLLEGVPGIAKTLAVETLAKVVGGEFVRIQFTPDLLPADIVGTRIWRASTETFDIELGPILANFVLADEINRAPAKVQSALLEAMAERQVSVGGETFAMPDPFLVLATQNPIESEGVYPLPEAQRDRFLMKIVVDYPTPAEEVEIVQRMGVNPPVANRVFELEQLQELQRQTADVYVDRNVVDYAVGLTLATREPQTYGLHDLAPLISYGSSPRASLGLVAAGRAIAVIRGRNYVLPQDIFDVAPEVMRHRMVLSYEALARDITADHVVAQILSTVPAPRIAPSQDRTFGARGATA